MSEDRAAFARAAARIEELTRELADKDAALQRLVADNRRLGEDLAAAQQKAAASEREMAGLRDQLAAAKADELAEADAGDGILRAAVFVTPQDGQRHETLDAARVHLLAYHLGCSDVVARNAADKAGHVLPLIQRLAAK